MFNKRGEVDNKFLLIVLVLVVAIVFLSNNGLFTGRYTRSFNVIENQQAAGTKDSIYVPNIYSTTSRGYGSLVGNIQSEGGGTQYATGSGWCECPISSGSNPDGSSYAEYIINGCSGSYPACGTCNVGVSYFPKPIGGPILDLGPIERSCTSHYLPVCGNGIIDVGEQCDPPYSYCSGGICSSNCICRLIGQP